MKHQPPTVQKLYVLNDSQMQKLTKSKNRLASGRQHEQSGGGPVDVDGKNRQDQVERIESKIKNLLKVSKKGGKRTRKKKGRVVRRGKKKVAQPQTYLDEKGLFKYEKFKRLQDELQNALQWFRERSSPHTLHHYTLTDPSSSEPKDIPTLSQLKQETVSIGARKKAKPSSYVKSEPRSRPRQSPRGGPPLKRPASLDGTPIPEKRKRTRRIVSPRKLTLRSDKHKQVVNWKGLDGQEAPLTPHTREPIHDQILEGVRRSNIKKKELKHLNRLMHEVERKEIGGDGEEEDTWADA